jgi:hypothetical protein
MDLINSICNKAPEYFIYSSKLPGTTHGNEPAGYYILKEYMDMINSQNVVLTRGTIIFIPVVNYCGFQSSMRYHPIIGDINAKYDYKEPINVINDLVIKFVKKSDFVIDFHEGYSFHKLNKNSAGSTITPINSDKSIDIANYVVSNLNLNILEDYKKFIVINTTLDNIINHTLRQYISLYEQNRDYILVELSGQDDIQPLELRMSQGVTIISSVVSYFNMDK